MSGAPGSELVVRPVTAERWPDLEALFGKNGAHGGCWCMFWRLRRADYQAMTGEGRRDRLRGLALAGEEPGVLATLAGQPVGWCAVGPREDFLALENSRILKRVHAQPVWSIACFFVSKTQRRRGITRALLAGAVAFAAARGASLIEGYPIDLQSPPLAGQKLTSVGGYMGIASVYRQLGFVEVGRASETQLIMRLDIS